VFSVENNQRHKRLRLLIRRLNRERKTQAKKIDILCNDLIAAQRDFIKRLNTITFMANFYETIMATTELSSLILTACRFIKEEIPDANIAFFLRQAENFELHIVESEHSASGETPPPARPRLGAGSPQGGPVTLQEQPTVGYPTWCPRFENCFTHELVDNICKSNKMCTIDDMLTMGLQGSPVGLNKISAATLPLGQPGQPLGFILIYRPSQNELSADELNKISAVTSGLSRAIASCHVPSN
jgi:hypothetical protein